MTMLIKVRMLSLVSIMSTYWQKELNVVEGKACSYFRPMWKLASRVMVTKVSWNASWVAVRSLPYHKRWIPIGSMGCVHTHQGIPAIEGWGSPNHVWIVIKKIGENNWKDGKASQTTNQMLTPRLKHDKIQT
jgi:hypothetical protein